MAELAATHVRQLDCFAHDPDGWASPVNRIVGRTIALLRAANVPDAVIWECVGPLMDLANSDLERKPARVLVSDELDDDGLAEYVEIVYDEPR